MNGPFLSRAVDVRLRRLDFYHTYQEFLAKSWSNVQKIVET